MNHAFDVVEVSSDKMTVSISGSDFVSSINGLYKVRKFLEGISVGMGVYVTKYCYEVNRRRGAFYFGVIREINIVDLKVIVEVEL